MLHRPPMTDWPAYSAKYHTTADQLAEIGNRTQPRLLIMYHISGRVPDEQLLEEIQKTYRGKIVIGKDLEIYCSRDARNFENIPSTRTVLTQR